MGRVSEPHHNSFSTEMCLRKEVIIEAQSPLAPVSITGKVRGVKRWEPVRGGITCNSIGVIHLIVFQPHTSALIFM